jgi:selenocysteine lyase/cysteine desulfurase
MVLDRSADFFGFGDWTFLNCAFHGPLPRVAADALDAAVALRKNPAAIRNDYHFTFPNAYRTAIASLIGADPSTVALTDSATAGTMLIVTGLDWREGDEVVIPGAEFPSNRLPFLSLASRGVTVREVDLDAAADPTAQLIGALSRETRVLAVSWVSFIDGRRLDLAALSAACRDRGVLFAVDGSQGAGGLPLDLEQIHCDLFSCAGYKWLLGPYGLGFARVHPDLMGRLRLGNINWFASEGSEHFNRLADLSLAPHDDARRFDANEPANFYNVAAGTAAARYIMSITPEAIETHCRALHDHLVNNLPPEFTPLGIDAPLRSNIVCFKGPDEEVTARVLRYVRSRQIAVSSRENAIRVSPHVYNTVADIDRLLQALTEAVTGAPEPPGTAEGEDSPHERIRQLLGLPD